MLMLVSWNFTPEERDAVYKRYSEVAKMEIPGLQAIGRWHVLGRNGGCAVVDAESHEAVAALTLAWNDVCSLTIEPVVTDKQYEAAIGGGD